MNITTQLNIYQTLMTLVNKTFLYLTSHVAQVNLTSLELEFNLIKSYPKSIFSLMIKGLIGKRIFVFVFKTI